MKVAIIFTGALRTIKKTMKFFVKNLLLHSDVHVFACVQNDTNIENSEYEAWLYSELGDHLKCVEWFYMNSNLINHRDNTLNNMNINNNVIHYLQNSGSMIEYYQLQIAYTKMMNFERKHSKYDYIVRVRTDTIFAKPIDFHWLNWSDKEVESRVERIKQELINSNIELSDYNIINYFMKTIISDDIISNIPILGDIIKNRDKLPDICSLNDYIKNGSYILTLRKNLLYIIRRDLFYVIPFLGTIYGYIEYHGSDDYWWNAESQFQSICYNSNITLYDYNTVFDDSSLYNYDEKKYFDSEYNIINPYMLYCLVRN